MNVLRSVTRYLTLALGDPWEIRFGGSAQEGALERPFAGVVPATPTTSIAHGARHAELRQTLSISAYPVEGISDESSLLEAMRVERMLWRAFAQGIDPASFSARSARAHPLRVPLYDYAGVGLFEAVDDTRRAGFARVIEPPAFQSFDAGGAFVVVGDLRLAWQENVAVPVPATPTRIVGATIEAA